MIKIAHRGASLLAPENTLPAFSKAIEAGINFIEFDIHLSKDGEMVVCHDDDLSRTTDGKGLLKDMTLAELKKLDAGKWFSEEYEGTRIPTLDEVLEICHKNMLINIEIKNIPFFHKRIEEKTVETVRQYGLEENVIISSFDHESLLTIQQIAPDFKIGLLFSNNLVNIWDYIHLTGIHAQSLHFPYTFVTRDLIKEAHIRGYKVYPFTVDDKTEAERQKSIGTDGIFTNDIYLNI